MTKDDILMQYKKQLYDMINTGCYSLSSEDITTLSQKIDNLLNEELEAKSQKK